MPGSGNWAAGSNRSAIRLGGLVAGDKAVNGVLAGPEYHTVDYNHFEVLLADPVIDLAREFLFETAA